jgi:putative membrane protein
MKKLIVSLGCIFLGLLPASYAVSTDKSKVDQQFVNEAARGGKMEVELGQLAQKNGSSAEVKQFGQQMVTDHTKLNDELGKAAKTAGLKVPTQLNAKQQAEFQALSKTSGKEFDLKYAQLMVKDHTDDLAAFKKAESTTQSPDLKKAIAGAIPVIQHHLEMAKTTAQKVGGR